MRENGFLEADWAIGTIGDILRALPPKHLITIELSESVGQAIRTFKERGISQLPVVDNGRLAGILTETDVLHVVVDGRASSETAIAEVMQRKVSTVSLHTSASELPTIFDRGEVAIVVDAEQHVHGLLTKVDLIDFLTHTPANDAPLRVR